MRSLMVGVFSVVLLRVFVPAGVSGALLGVGKLRLVTGTLSVAGETLDLMGESLAAEEPLVTTISRGLVGEQSELERSSETSSLIAQSSISFVPSSLVAELFGERSSDGDCFAVSVSSVIECESTEDVEASMPTLSLCSL